MSEICVLKISTGSPDDFSFAESNTQKFFIVAVPKLKKEQFLSSLKEEFQKLKENKEQLPASITKVNYYFKELFNNRVHTKRIFLNRFKREPVILNAVNELEENGIDMEDPSSCIKLSHYLQSKRDIRSEGECINDVITSMELTDYQNIEDVKINF